MVNQIDDTPTKTEAIKYTNKVRSLLVFIILKALMHLNY